MRVVKAEEELLELLLLPLTEGEGAPKLPMPPVVHAGMGGDSARAPPPALPELPPLLLLLLTLRTAREKAGPQY